MKNQFSGLYISREQRDRWAAVGALCIAITLALVLLIPVNHLNQTSTISIPQVHIASK